MVASLDVSDLLTDPDFCDPIVIQRNSQSVTAQGLGVTTPSQVQIGACVVPAGSLDLYRGMDAELLKGKIHIYTRFPLTAGENGITADIVFWRGRQYTVSAVDDFSNFGIGFVDATADLMPTHNQMG